MFPTIATLAPPKKPRNLAQGVVAHLTGRIRNGSLHPGDRLPTELETMRDLGVGRSVVREAMSQLQAAGLVETRHGIGTFMRAAASHDLPALLELRIALETEAAGLAAARRSGAQLTQLRDALDNFAARPGAPPQEMDFHLLVAQCANNRYFHDVLARLSIAEDDARDRERTLRGRQQIYDAIARRDSETARAAMRTHLTNRC